MASNQIPLIPDKYYHVYNRGNNGEKLFYSGENYDYFLSKYFEAIKPVAETLCFCLMSNHFHFIVKVKSEAEIIGFLMSKKEGELYFPQKEDLSLAVSKQFSNLFNGYTQALNKQQERYGTLFSRPFKRKLIDSSDYLKNLILYVHLNPVNHGYTIKPENWKFSSYPLIISGKQENINREEVIGLFDDINNFEELHRLKANEKKGSVVDER